MLELFQTEWCPASRRIRQRLTELGVEYVTRQVAVERDERAVLYAATGSDTIPALLLEDGSAVVGEDEILAHLDEHYDESEEVAAHRAKAAKARRRYLEEECPCLPLATR
jgi:glutathione S-transferase